MAAAPQSMHALCAECRHLPSTGPLHWYAALPWLFLDGLRFRESLCRDCAGGKEFVSLFCYASLIAAGVVLGIVLWA